MTYSGAYALAVVGACAGWIWLGTRRKAGGPPKAAEPPARLLADERRAPRRKLADRRSPRSLPFVILAVLLLQGCLSPRAHRIALLREKREIWGQADREALRLKDLDSIDLIFRGNASVACMELIYMGVTCDYDQRSSQ